MDPIHSWQLLLINHEGKKEVYLSMTVIGILNHRFLYNWCMCVPRPPKIYLALTHALDSLALLFEYHSRAKLI